MTHWFWFSLILATIIWYVIVTILVAFRGGKNIREMIKHLKG